MWRGKIKATQFDALFFIYEQEVVTLHDLVDRFDYTRGGAKNRLIGLHSEKLIQPLITRGTWGLTTTIPVCAGKKPSSSNNADRKSKRSVVKTVIF